MLKKKKVLCVRTKLLILKLRLFLILGTDVTHTGNERAGLCGFVTVLTEAWQTSSNLLSQMFFRRPALGVPDNDCRGRKKAPINLSPTSLCKEEARCTPQILILSSKSPHDGLILKLPASGVLRKPLWYPLLSPNSEHLPPQCCYCPRLLWTGAVLLFLEFSKVSCLVARIQHPVYIHQGFSLIPQESLNGND